MRITSIDPADLRFRAAPDIEAAADRLAAGGRFAATRIQCRARVLLIRRAVWPVIQRDHHGKVANWPEVGAAMLEAMREWGANVRVVASVCHVPVGVAEAAVRAAERKRSVSEMAPASL